MNKYEKMVQETKDRARTNNNTYAQQVCEDGHCHVERIIDAVECEGITDEEKLETIIKEACTLLDLLMSEGNL